MTCDRSQHTALVFWPLDVKFRFDLVFTTGIRSEDKPCEGNLRRPLHSAISTYPGPKQKHVSSYNQAEDGRQIRRRQLEYVSCRA